MLVMCGCFCDQIFMGLLLIGAGCLLGHLMMWFHDDL